MEKIGVVLSRVQDIQEIFRFYDSEKKGLINYKEFAQKIFSKEKNLNKRNEYDTNYLVM